jgi:hypothetical protein
MDHYGAIINGISSNSCWRYELCAKPCGDASQWAFIGVDGNGYRSHRP